jgi:hypothetical protein
LHHPQAFSWPPLLTMASHSGGDLERERLTVLEMRAAVQSDARNADDREFHGQHIAFLAVGIIAGRAMHGAD